MHALGITSTAVVKWTCPQCGASATMQAIADQKDAQAALDAEHRRISPGCPYAERR